MKNENFVVYVGRFLSNSLTLFLWVFHLFFICKYDFLVRIPTSFVISICKIRFCNKIIGILICEIRFMNWNNCYLIKAGTKEIYLYICSYISTRFCHWWKNFRSLEISYKETALFYWNRLSRKSLSLAHKKTLYTNFYDLYPKAQN